MGKKGIFEKVEAEVVDAAKDYVKNKVKKKIIKFGEFSILAFLALIMISIGIAQLIGFYFPQIANGLNFVILGVIFMIVGLLIRI